MTVPNGIAPAARQPRALAALAFAMAVLGLTAFPDSQVKASAVPVPIARPDTGGPSVRQVSAAIPLPIARPLRIAGLASPSDAAWRTTLTFAERGAWKRALAVTGRKPDPALEAVMTWLSLKDNSRRATFDEVETFLDRNPGWPEERILVERAEHLMPEDLPLGRQIAWFAKHPPRTADGELRRLAALAASAEPGTLVQAVRETWRRIEIGRRDERAFLKAYGQHLRERDHIERLDRMLWLGRTGAARRTMKFVPEGWKRLADARLRLRYRKAGVDAAIKRIPQELRGDPGLHYERLRWRRKAGLRSSAREMLFDAPPSDQFKRLWWRERSWHVREAIETGELDDAYLLAASHIQRSGGPFAEAEWLAGWIALRFLDRPQDALRHFGQLHANVSTPISSGRAAYWAGRASEALGDSAGARTWYERGARFQTTFYGQLAAARIGVDRIELPSPPRPGPDARAAFDGDGRVRAAGALLRLRLDDLSRPFLRHLARASEDIDRSALIADLAGRNGQTDTAVFAARRAALARMILPALGYPTVGPFAGPGPEPALVHAIIRQESSFETTAVSRVGARGLMQLMPATAKETARGLGRTYRRDALLTDPDYNIALGRAYLQRLITRFDGHYVLAIAAYNAGPGRVVRWIREHGHPKDPGVDVIDWIERIPFAETRNYVQRVLEALHVYRRRLEGDPVQRLAAAATDADARKLWCVYACGVLMDRRQAQLSTQQEAANR